MVRSGTVSRSDLEERLRFESMLADLSSNFVNVAPDAVDAEIIEAQRRVCESLGIDLSALWQWSPEPPHDLVMTHLYRPLGGPPVPEKMDGTGFFPWCQENLLAGGSICLRTLDEAPPEAAGEPVVEIDDVASRRGFDLVAEILGRAEGGAADCEKA
jgi:hypothetical protein